MIKNTAYMKRRGARLYAGAAAERCILREEKRRAVIRGLFWAAAAYVRRR